MGLNAAVYKKLSNIPLSQEQLKFVSVDPVNGQIDLEGAELYAAFSQKVKAVEKRIGNIAMVSRLRSKIQDILGNSSSLLVDKVLYNGVHSYDLIAANDFEQLRQEIVSIRRQIKDNESADLELFLRDMEELMSAAEREGNPILFI